MAIARYQINFITRYGRVATVDEFAAGNDGQAVYVAALIHGAVADVFPAYEVWQGLRRITQRLQPLELWQAQLAQEIAIEREEMLQKSRTLIDKSRLLSDALDAARRIGAQVPS